MRYFRLLLLVAITTIAMGCKKPVNNDPPLPQPDVTYENINGKWEMVNWNGEEISEDTYLYFEFDGEARRFEMWDNLGSMYTQHKAGSFSIKEDDGAFILSGQYDNGVGDWTNTYEVRMLAQGEKMVWYADEENTVFSRIDEIPELN